MLPIYRRLALGQPSVSCSFGLIGQDKKILKDNKIGNHHFILFDAPAAGRYRLTFKGGLHKDGTYVHPEVSWLERGRRTWHRPNSTEFDLDLQLPSGPTVLSVTDRDVNAGQAEAGCLRVVISNAPVI